MLDTKLILTAGMRRVQEADRFIHGAALPRDIREILWESFERHHEKTAVADELGISRYTLDLWLGALGGTVQSGLVFDGWVPEAADV
jgi:hypothetical protein